MDAFSGNKFKSSGTAGFPGAGSLLDLTFKSNMANGMVEYTPSQEDDNDFCEQAPQNLLEDVNTNSVNIGTYAENSGFAKVIDFHS